MTEKKAAPEAAPRIPVLIWAAGLALRLLFIAFEPSTTPVADETMWLMALRRIPSAGFSPFANYPIFHPPLYPYFLAAAHAVTGSLTGIKVLQALLGSLLIPALYRLGRASFGQRAGIGAAAIAALYPELIWYAAHFWCETLFLVFFWWALERTVAASSGGSLRDAALAGALFGLAVLTRETLLYVMPMAALFLVFAGGQRRLRHGVILVAVALAFVLPWTARNWIQFHAFIPVSTGGGLNLYQGNAPLSRNEVYAEYYANEGKVEQYQWARAAGLRAIWDRQPAWIFEKIRDEGPRLAEADSLALIHIRRGAYGEVPCGTYRTAATVVLLPWLIILGAALLSLSRLRLEGATLWLPCVTGAYLLLHIATHGFSRYRLPVLPSAFLLTAALLEQDCASGRTPARRALLVVLVVAAGLLLAPSVLEQAGYWGLMAPSDVEGFAPVCPAL